MNKNLILIDERKILQFGLKAFIESASSWKVLISAQGKDDLLQKLEENNSFSSSDLFTAIIDIKCGQDSGFEIIKILKNKIPGIKCIIYTDYSSYGNLTYAFENGVEGFLSKDCHESELILALDGVSQGRTYIQQDLMKEILLLSNRLSNLSIREKQVLDLICDGYEKKDICSKLKISVRTCENYYSVLYSKLLVNDVKEIQEKYGIKEKNSYSGSHFSSTNSDESSQKITLTQDSSHTGNGVKILYSNVPKKASVLEITLRSPGIKAEQISFMENDTWGKNREFFNLGYYVYPFLDAGREYTFDFVFKAKNREIVEKASITVVPEKGESIYIEKTNRNNISINPETLECSFKDVSLPKLPDNARICVSMWTSNWQYIGYMYREFSEIKELGPYNFYKDIDYSTPSVNLDSVKKVLFQFYFAYECYEWSFFVSDTVSFYPERV